MEIQVGKVCIRPWLDSDATQLADIANNRNIADNLRDTFPFPYTLKDAKQWIAFMRLSNKPPRYFAIEYESWLAGSIGIILKEDIYRKNAEIGYFIAERFQGKGIASTVVKEIVSYIFTEFEILRVYAEPFANNTPSRRVLEKAGFTCEAVLRKYIEKNGELLDSCIYSLLKEDWTP